MISPENAEEVILKALHQLNAERPPAQKLAVGPDSPLVGRQSGLDSLALVCLISDVEAELNEKYGISISLTDDQAMGGNIFPFTDVQSLKQYIVKVAQ